MTSSHQAQIKFRSRWRSAFATTRRSLIKQSAGAVAATLAVLLPTAISSAADLPDKPNVLVIVAEDMGPHVGCYGDHTVPTPNIDRLAKEGVRFENGYVTQASCSPSRSSILTGLHVYQSFQLGLAPFGYTMHKGVPNLPELLQQRGYRTGILGKLHVNPENEFPFDYRSGSHDPAILAARADEFLKDTGDQPFFLTFNFWDCHRDQRGGGPPFPDTRFGLPEDPVEPKDVNMFPEHGEMDEPNVREEVAGYYNSVQRVDIGIGMLRDALVKHNKLDSTLIIFIGDHGPAFSRGKTTTYEFGIKVPCIVRWPGMAKPGLVSGALVSTIDLLPTCLSAAGLEVPSYLPGRSLVPVLQGEDGNWRSTLVAEWHTHGPGFQQPQRSIRDGRYKLILNMRPGVRKPGLGIDGCKVAQALKLSKYNGTEVQRVFNLLNKAPEIELYDLREDPIEYHNLADDPAHQETKDRLLRQLRAYRQRTGDPFLDRDFFDKVLRYTEANIGDRNIDMTPFQRDFKDIENGLRSGATITYTGDGTDLQRVIDKAPAGSTVLCDRTKQFEFTQPLLIRKAITLTGLNARLPKELGRTPLVVVQAEGVSITGVELHGNYDSVSQDVRAALLQVRAGKFRVERCAFYDSSKDGIEVSPPQGGGDVVGGVIRDIEGFRLGRDAVSISGGNQGEKVRDLTVENVSLKTGYERGAVEISDGTDNITVRRVYAEQCSYAVDVQDHGGESAANTNIVLEDVTAMDCRHILRTANSPRGHANLTLRKFTGIRCLAPIRITHTKNVTIEDLTILEHTDRKSVPVYLGNCQGVLLRNVTVQSAAFADKPINTGKKCTDVLVEGLKRKE